MGKKLRLLILGVFTVSCTTQAMNNHITSQALFFPAIDVILYCIIKEAQQELARNPFALHAACESGDLEKAKILLAAGADVNLQGRYEHTPLHRAAAYGHARIVDLLIKHNACLESKSNVGETALHRAVYMRHTEVVKVLLQQGACIERKNKSDTTPLHYALYGGYDVITQLFVYASFFPPRPLPADPSLQERCLIILLMQLDKADQDEKKFLLQQLVHRLTVNDAAVRTLVDRIPLQLQRSFTTLLQEHRAQRAHPCTSILQEQKAQEALALLVKAHANRHFQKVKEMLETQNTQGETVHDIALASKHPGIIALFEQLHQTEGFDQLDEALKDAIIKNMQQRFLISSSADI